MLCAISLLMVCERITLNIIHLTAQGKRQGHCVENLSTQTPLTELNVIDASNRLKLVLSDIIWHVLHTRTQFLHYSTLLLSVHDCG